MNHKKTKFGYYYYCISVCIAICHVFSHVHVDARSTSSHHHKTIQLAKLEGAIKTIQTEYGDIIDCVDIYKQPAFNHPLLKNHTIQMKPSSYPIGMKAEEETLEAEMIQDWNKNEDCPEGTIPILTSPHHKPPRKRAFVSATKHLDVDVPRNHEYAQVSVVDGNYFGASARINVWKPATFNNEFSLAQIWVLSGSGDELNTVEAGWQTYKRDPTRFFIFWTSDGYGGTGCYNLECPGFVQTSRSFTLGGKIEPVSTYGGPQFEIRVYIHKDKRSGNWWLRLQEVDVGYWPGSIFHRLSDRAEIINWGGEIINLGLQGRHTSTQMGSGHFPSEGFKKASFFRNIRYVDESGAIKDAHNVVPYVTKPACYDLKMGNIRNFGTNFFFGGPGYSNKCLQ